VGLTTKLSELLASGQAQYGEYVGTGGLMVIPIPKGKGMVITQIKLKAFADIPAPSDFREGSNWDSRFAWHQLRVIGKKGTAMYKARHDLRNVTRLGSSYLLPIGEHNWDCFLNHEENVVLELTHAPLVSSYTTILDRLPSKNIYNPNPPSGYGHAPTGLVSTQYLRHIPEGFEVRPYNTYSPPLAGVPISFTQSEWSIKSTTQLNAPQPTIVFGEYTIPEVRIQFIWYNKQINATFVGNVKP